LQTLGAEGISWPTFSYEATAIPETDRNLLEHIDSYDWLIFTSAHAVHYFLKHFDALYVTRTQLQKIPVACVGDQTAAVANENGLAVSLVPPTFDVKHLANVPEFSGTHALRILIPQARDANHEALDLLALRHHIDSLVVYEKQIVKHTTEEKDNLQKQMLDWIVFFSPSAIRFFMEDLTEECAKNILQRTPLAVIGPTTATYLTQHGLSAQVVANRASAEALFRALL